MAGLGNPGRQYLDNRHNAGWMLMDRVAELRGVDAEEQRYESMTARSGNLLLLKPLTYMNRSGKAVGQAVERERVELDSVLVALDDVDLTLGSVRLRPSGSSGGHRGLQSVIDRLGTDEVTRLRLGVGPCPPRVPTSDFVLSDFGPDETDALDDMLERGAKAALCWAREGTQAAMNEYNYTAPS
jgi:PTH1 family peptidyl-tRNA hydrolase